MRVLSLNLREALFSQESSEVVIFLLTITHAELDDPIYLTSDPTERYQTDPLGYRTVSRSIDFLYVGMDLTFPDEQDRSPPASRLTISNVARDLIPLARSVSTPPSVKIEVVKASDLDTVEVVFPAMDMVNLQYDANQLQFTLTMDALTSEPFPSGSFNPASFPGLFY